MPSGKVHAFIAIACCGIVFIVVTAVKGISFWGLIFVLIFAEPFSRLPDEVLDKDTGLAHRNWASHSALLPGLFSAAVIVLTQYWMKLPLSYATYSNALIQLAMYWCIAHGSHIFADAFTKLNIGRWFHAINGIGLFVLATYLGWLII